MLVGTDTNAQGEWGSKVWLVGIIITKPDRNLLPEKETGFLIRGRIKIFFYDIYPIKTRTIKDGWQIIVVVIIIIFNGRHDPARLKSRIS